MAGSERPQKRGVEEEPGRIDQLPLAAPDQQTGPRV